MKRYIYIYIYIYVCMYTYIMLDLASFLYTSVADGLFMIGNPGEYI